MFSLRVAALAVIAIFYIAYFSKMLLQHKNGVQTNQIGKGAKLFKVLIIETLVKIATYVVVFIEVISILANHQIRSSPYRWIGILVAAIGVIVFISAMWTMKNNWRAGIPAKDKTELVTTGIYRFSRNPAFLGFDLMYIGILVAFFNYVHLFSVLFAVTMLHLQILQEERFLERSFGEAYDSYKRRTGRYF